MTVLRDLGDRLSGRHSSAVTKSETDAAADSAPVAGIPFAGYDRLDARQVTSGLSDHSQVELEAVENYERSHKAREPVLDKLRYMRGREPLAGYDALSVEEIVNTLQEADVTTIKKVRGYERKFANRPAILDEVTRVHHLKQGVGDGA